MSVISSRRKPAELPAVQPYGPLSSDKAYFINRVPLISECNLKLWQNIIL